MPPIFSARQALDHLHQMAGLGLQGPQLIGPVLQALHALVGFDAGGYVHAGSDGTLQTYLENPRIQAREADYFDPQIQRSEGETFRCRLHDLGHAAHIGTGPLLLEQLLQVPYAHMLRSDFYNVLLRPAGVTDWTTWVLRARNGRALGSLILYRHMGARPFTREELFVLERLQVHLVCILQSEEAGTPDSDVAGEGLLITSEQGHAQWLSPEAAALLRLAFSWRWRGTAGALPEPLQELLRRLRASAVPGEPLPVPQMEWGNAHGWFTLRATRMAAARGAQHAVALHITRRVARGPRLLAALRALGLPTRQRELAWWMAHGLPESQIAERMGISVNTVVYHRRQLYNRVGAQTREDLLGCLQRRVAMPVG